MLTFLCKRICVLAVSVCLVGLPLLQTANAAVISTEQAFELDDRQGRIDRINEVLAKDSVQNMLVRLGVDATDASARVEALTDAELLTLDQQLEDLPAGGVGVVEVIGIVAIVLIVLELLNVTNFFNEF
jgi:hypothetical protein